MNKPISYPLAKLLKEKGFDEEAIVNVYHPSDQTRAYPKEYIKEGDYILAPILADVIMWLYEKHQIWVSVHLEKCRSYVGYDFNFELVNDYARTISEQEKAYKALGETVFNSPTEAYEAAIEYILTELI